MGFGSPCIKILGDRPFNLQGGGEGLCFFVSSRIFFSDNTRVRIFFFCRTKREIFFQKSTLGYMTNTLNQIKKKFLHQNQNILFSNIGNQTIFLEKKHNPPFKLNGRSLIFQIKTKVPPTQKKKKKDTKNISPLTTSWCGCISKTLVWIKIKLHYDLITTF